MTPDPAALANLRDLALPAPVAWWPPPFAWWVLAAALLAFALLLGTWLGLRYRDDAYRRAAARDLRALAAAAPSTLAPAIASVLKRTALVAYPRASVASLTGGMWSAFLGRTGGFPPAAAAALARATLDPSRALNPAEAGAILAAAQRWIRLHRRDGTAS
jgi:hypothetical protein